MKNQKINLIIQSKPSPPKFYEFSKVKLKIALIVSLVSFFSLILISIGTSAYFFQKNRTLINQKPQLILDLENKILVLNNDIKLKNQTISNLQQKLKLPVNNEVTLSLISPLRSSKNMINRKIISVKNLLLSVDNKTQVINFELHNNSKKKLTGYFFIYSQAKKEIFYYPSNDTIPFDIESGERFGISRFKSVEVKMPYLAKGKIKIIIFTTEGDLILHQQLVGA